MALTSHLQGLRKSLSSELFFYVLMKSLYDTDVSVLDYCYCNGISKGQIRKYFAANGTSCEH